MFLFQSPSIFPLNRFLQFAFYDGWFGFNLSDEDCELITNHKYLVMLKTISGSFPTNFIGSFSKSWIVSLFFSHTISICP